MLFLLRLDFFLVVLRDFKRIFCVNLDFQSKSHSNMNDVSRKYIAGDSKIPLPKFIPGKLPLKPLNKIALSLSGGGYRAASFHLGGMSYLNHLHHEKRPLLERVEMISTVSGGSILGVVYALMKQDNGNTFGDIYLFLLNKLKTIDLVSSGIQKLNPDQSLRNDKKAKNLINAFAEQYEEHFTQGATLAEFEKMNSHLKSVVFNATEFSSAINFRFRNPGNALSGNNSFKVSNKISSEVKLSDVLASSSCFPGGFEPLRWPDDYCHQNSPLLDELCRDNRLKGKAPAGIMDGGIYDNQGVDSILLYNKKKTGPHFDLVIISDVASPDMEAYKSFVETKKTGNWKSLTINQLVNQSREISSHIYCGLGLSFAISLILPFTPCMKSEFWSGVSFTIAAFSFAFIATKWFAIRCTMHKLSEFGNFIRSKFPDFYYIQLCKLKIYDLSMHRVEPLLYNRLNSLKVLLSDVFLKIIRRLNYNRLYENANYQYRRATTLIKELTQKDWESKHPQLSYQLQIGPKIKAVVEEAAQFGTTLWFTEEEKLGELLKKLVVTGEITMCYNIKAYLEEITAPSKNGKTNIDFMELPKETRSELLKTLETCKRDWKKFQSDPAYLFDFQMSQVPKS
jgi:predicted acylesterase/phospholipase RssA